MQFWKFPSPFSLRTPLFVFHHRFRFLAYPFRRSPALFSETTATAISQLQNEGVLGLCARSIN